MLCPLDVPPSASPSSMLLEAWEHQAQHRPHAIALRADLHETWTYADLARTAHAWAAHWCAMGLKRGDRVVIRCAPGPTWVLAVWAAWYAQLVWTSCSNDLSNERTKAWVKAWKPRLIVRSDGWLKEPMLDLIEDTRPPHPFSSYDLNDGPSFVPHRGNVDDACVWNPWARDVGPEQAVLSTHAQCWSIVQARVRMAEMTENTVAMPLSSALTPSFLGLVGATLSVGGTVVFESPQPWMGFEAWCRSIRRHGTTVVEASPAWLNNWATSYPPPGLRTIIAGGSPTSKALIGNWSTRVRWINLYGPMEALDTCSGELRRVSEGQPAPTTLGDPWPDVRFRLQPEESLSPIHPLVNEGELWVSGPMVTTQSAFEQPSSRLWTDEHGTVWCRTGDRVRRSGKTWNYVGRCDRDWLQRGRTINLDALEQALRNMSGVLHCAAWIAPRPTDDSPLTSSERLIMAVHALHPFEPDALVDLQHRWRKEAPIWAQPDVWWLCEPWPFNSQGKTDRPVLQQRWNREPTVIQPASL